MRYQDAQKSYNTTRGTQSNHKKNWNSVKMRRFLFIQEVIIVFMFFSFQKVINLSEEFLPRDSILLLRINHD